MKFISYFLLFILFYHILITGLGGFGIEPTALVAGSKDVLWVGIVLWIIYIGFEKGVSKIKSISKTVRNAIIGLGLLAIAGVVYSYFLGVNISQILVGFKYSLRPLVILLESVVIGVLYKDQWTNQGFLSIETLGKVVFGIIIVGFIWQGAKVLLPELFMSFGYGPVGDFVVGQAAPIWYRTGPGGTMRRQGIFAGPNNYGYFLTAFASVLAVRVAQLRATNKKRLSGSVVILFLTAVILTYSRGALLGVGIQLILLLWWFAPQWKKTLYWIGGIGVLGVVGLSIWKRGSTVLHFQAWFDGMDAIIANPWGYGLGSSGPSVHYAGVYLPENQYLQIALDLGVWGLVIWLGIWVLLLRGVLSKGMIKRGTINFLLSHGVKRSGIEVECASTETITFVYEDTSTSSVGQIVCYKNNVSTLLFPLLLGGLGLFVIGMFLHVLEDSMVNYWYLSVLGVCIGMVLGTPRKAGNQ